MWTAWRNRRFEDSILARMNTFCTKLFGIISISLEYPLFTTIRENNSMEWTCSRTESMPTLWGVPWTTNMENMFWITIQCKPNFALGFRFPSHWTLIFFVLPSQHDPENEGLFLTGQSALPLGVSAGQETLSEVCGQKFVTLCKFNFACGLFAQGSAWSFSDPSVASAHQKAWPFFGRFLHILQELQQLMQPKISGN